MTSDDELLKLETAAIQSIDGELRGPALKAAARIRELKAENYHLMNSAELMREELSGVYAGTHVIVPVEPTQQMAEAIHAAIDEAWDHPDVAVCLYRAIIRAAQPGTSD